MDKLIDIELYTLKLLKWSILINYYFNTIKTKLKNCHQFITDHRERKSVHLSFPLPEWNTVGMINHSDVCFRPQTIISICKYNWLVKNDLQN